MGSLVLFLLEYATCFLRLCLYTSNLSSSALSLEGRQVLKFPSFTSPSHSQSTMDPYHNFDHRPLCADHREITLPRKAVNTIDHTNIAPSGGPVRTQKDLPRVTPYSSPSPEPQH